MITPATGWKWIEVGGNLRSREIRWNTVVMGIYSELYQRYLVEVQRHKWIQCTFGKKVPTTYA